MAERQAPGRGRGESDLEAEATSQHETTRQQEEASTSDPVPSDHATDPIDLEYPTGSTIAPLHNTHQNRPSTPSSASQYPTYYSSRTPTPIVDPPNHRNSIAKPPGTEEAHSAGLTCRQATGFPAQHRASASNTPNSSNSQVPFTNNVSANRLSQTSFAFAQRPTSIASNTLQPAHPYGLYQQGTFDEPEDSNENAPSTLVGMNDGSANFRRTRGIDGEELGVVGPDGHTEQLPPYTRYPVIGPTLVKESQPSSALLVGNATEQQPSSEESARVISTEDPHMASSTLPAVVDQPNEQPTALDSDTNVDPPVSPSPVVHATALGATRTMDAHVCSHTSSEASSLLEKPEFTKMRQRRRDRKIFCGTVPLWCVILFTLFCMVLALVAGAVVGGLITRHEKTRNNRVGGSVVTVTSVPSMYDASPIPAPTGVAPLPTGTFFFPLGAPSQQERSCIEPSRDTTAWGCSVTNQLLLIDLRMYGTTPNAKIYPAPPPSGTEGMQQYGAQPPRGGYPIQKLQWVQDTRDAGRGPALYFQTVYNKLVIIEGEKFPTPDMSLRKRYWSNSGRKDYDGPAPSASYNPFMPRRYANKPGEEPWHCFWNGTTLEGFIYVKEDVPGAQTQKFTASQPTADASSVVASRSGTSVIATSTSSQQSITPSPQISARAVLPRSVTSSADSQTAAITTAPARFPLIVKINERRYPNPAFSPYCQRMVVNSDGSVVPKLDSSGNKIIETIKEPSWSYKNNKKFQNSEAASSDYVRDSPQQSARLRRALSELEYSSTQALQKRDAALPVNGCMCQWVSPFG